MAKANEGEDGNPISPLSDVDIEMNREKAAAAAAINQPPNSVSISTKIEEEESVIDTVSVNINEEESIATNPPTDQGRLFARVARELCAGEQASGDDTALRHIAQATQNSLRDAAGAFRVNGRGDVTPASSLAAECAESGEIHPTNLAATVTEGSGQTHIYTSNNLPTNIDIIAEATLAEQEPAVVAVQMDKFSIYVCGRNTRLWHLILLAARLLLLFVSLFRWPLHPLVNNPRSSSPKKDPKKY